MLRVLRLEIDQISAENKELAANLKSIAVEIEALLKDPPPAE
jgi:hypothetical protein